MKPLLSRIASITVVAVALGALGGCSLFEPDRHEGTYEIAGGSATGVYFAYGEQMATVLTAESGTDFTIAETNGSVENLLRVGTGDALLGFAQSDAAADAVAGVGEFEEPLPIRALARLYDEYVHVVVREDSEIGDITDLAGHTVSLGAEHSGVAVVASRILTAAGVDEASVENPRLDLGESIEAMEQGEIDGFFWVGGLPTPGIENLVESVPTRLLPVDAELVDRVNSVHDGVYRVSDFPVGAYGHDEPTSTMTVPNFLIASDAAPDDLITDALRIIFDARAEIAQFVPAFALLDRRQAIYTDPITLHPGAIEYYRGVRR